MKIKKCPKCKTYTLSNICKKCEKPAKLVSYKFRPYLEKSN